MLMCSHLRPAPQVGAYYPFFRGHAHLETQRREPWLFGDDATRRVRAAIRSRYALMPYLYTLFRAANASGAPVMRPLWYEFPEDTVTYGREEEFLLGPGILVAPVLAPGAREVAAYLPPSAVWYDARSGAVQRGAAKGGLLSRGPPLHRVSVDMEGIPVFYRGGAVVPLRLRPRRSTAQMTRDPLTLVVALDASGGANGDLYLDDGRSYAFKRGEYLHRQFNFRDGRLTARALQLPGTPTPVAGADAGGQAGALIEQVIILGLPEAPNGYIARVQEKGAAPRPAMVLRGPVDVTAGAAGHAHIVRQPGVAVGGDWEIAVEPLAKA